VDKLDAFLLAMLLTIVISYLLGSLNSAIISVKLLKKVDIRDFGSGNAGLTNVYRVCGQKAALITLAGDLGKGMIAVALSRLIFTWCDVGFDFTMHLESVAYLKTQDMIAGTHLHTYATLFAGYFAGIFAVLGHIKPIYYNFKGGKGVLVTASVLPIIDWRTFMIVIPFFLLLVFLTHYVSVSTLIAAFAYPFVTYYVQFVTGVPESIVRLNVVLVVITSLMIFYMHRSNIQRLQLGLENKFYFKKKPELADDTDDADE
jgi:glycerol-3-phosphate acyltransferase PlsY